MAEQAAPTPTEAVTDGGASQVLGKEEAAVQEVSDELVKVTLAELLKTADLATTTEKKLRKQLEEQLGCDLTSKKLLIRAEVEAFLTTQAGPEEQEEDGDDNAEEEQEEAAAKPKRKRRASTGASLGSVLSRPLQEFLGVESMPRPQVVKAIWAYVRENNLQDPKDKRNIIVDDKLRTIFKPPINMFTMNKQLSKHCRTKADVNGGASDADNVDDDDEDDDEEEARPKKKAAAKRAKKEKPEGSSRGGGGFTKPVKISEALQQFLGSGPEVPRSELTKRFWEYFKTNNLQDPSNKQIINCDQRLQDLLGVDSFKGFGLQKYLSQHIIS